MTKKEAARAVRRLINRYIADKNGFLGAGADVEPDDQAAMVLRGCSASLDEEKIHLLFYCAGSLDPSQPPVTGWMEECIAAARAALPEEAAVAELAVSCIRQNDADGGLTL